MTDRLQIDAQSIRLRPETSSSVGQVTCRSKLGIPEDDTLRDDFPKVTGFSVGHIRAPVAATNCNCVTCYVRRPVTQRVVALRLRMAARAEIA
jgi:hypothetical protein